MRFNSPTDLDVLHGPGDRQPRGCHCCADVMILPGPTSQPPVYISPTTSKSVEDFSDPDQRSHRFHLCESTVRIPPLDLYMGVVRQIRLVSSTTCIFRMGRFKSNCPKSLNKQNAVRPLIGGHQAFGMLFRGPCDSAKM